MSSVFLLHNWVCQGIISNQLDCFADWGKGAIPNIVVALTI